MRRITTLYLAAAMAALPAGLVPAPEAAAQTLRQRIDAVKEKREQQARRGARDHRVEILQALYYTDVTILFQETPARDAFEFIRTALGVNMVVHYADGPTGIGIEPDMPITVDAQEMQALELLELVLEQCSLTEASTWQLRRSFLEVGTKERLSVPAAQEIRTYPIDDIIFDPPRFTDAPSLRLDYALSGSWGSYGGTPFFPGSGAFGIGGGGGFGGSISVGAANAGSGGASDWRQQGAEQLIGLITEVIEPDVWTSNGGTIASIRYDSGALIVRAPDFVQRQIGGYPRVPRPEKGK